ncbi:MAG: ribonuclease J [Acidimicrobiales bacterium]|jgi:ribonuclease J|nr:ribonuclease J [Acidimicrobiales bacterium]MDP6911381.1 ribonuclease J [Acidimicrobiales bacterium]
MAAPVHLTFLGGLGEIGRNCAALEAHGRIVMLDCGQLFPDDMPGVDAVLPDFGWLLERADRLEACVVTHAHEDHIGGLPYLLRALGERGATLPIYGSPFTLGMVRGKLKFAGVPVPDLIPLGDYDRLPIGPFDCEFLPVTHSTPSGLMTVFHTPQGNILHSSDFKLDPTPIDGRVTDLDRVREIAADGGIRLLLADSTNAGSAGSSTSESTVGPVLRRVFDENEGRRIIIGAFSSHVHRIQQVADAAAATSRKLVVMGPSMVRNTTLARELGLLNISDKMLARDSDLDDLDPARTCIVCTGSQGESRAALNLMGQGRHRFVTVGDTDTVVFSSHPIPGNEAAVARLHNSLARRGARLVHSGQLGVHTTGHGKADELLALHDVADPDLFIPVHGEYSHLVAHHELALSRGMDEDRVLRCTDGDRVKLTGEGVAHAGRVPDGYVMVDEAGRPVSVDLLEERRAISGEGFVLIRVLVDGRKGRLAEPPMVESRGWVEPAVREDWHGQVVSEVTEALAGPLADGNRDAHELSRLTRRATGQLVSRKTGRKPTLVPIVEVR